MQKKKKILNLNTAQLVSLGFATVILAGAFLLTLPISSKSGEFTSFIDALFTATTSVCVTGLVVFDTGTYWSTFGHFIILILIQIGGLGVVTLAATFAMFAGRKISLFQRGAIQEAVAAPHIKGVVKLTIFIVKATFTIELAGAFIMLPTFAKEFGFLRGLWMAVFHSVSAFCNAGIDLMGTKEQFSSLTSYVDNPFINFAIMGLIILGGLGFLTWDDIKTQRIHFKKYRMQSKVILTTTALLIIIPAILFFFIDFSDLSLGKRILASLFQSVTTRTAGFNTVDLTTMSEASQMITIILMLIGGSPGSTAGGMKTTTFAILIATSIAVIRKRDSSHFYGRRVAQDIISTAITLGLMYVGLSSIAAMIISLYEGLPILSCMYETSSAIATVGLTLGITTKLHLLSKCIIIILMYIGRVGGLTLIYAAYSPKKEMGRLPIEKITVG